MSSMLARPSDPIVAIATAPGRGAVSLSGLRFHPTKTVTWDHRKLGGVY